MTFNAIQSFMNQSFYSVLQENIIVNVEFRSCNRIPANRRIPNRPWAFPTPSGTRQVVAFLLASDVSSEKLS